MGLKRNSVIRDFYDLDDLTLENLKRSQEIYRTIGAVTNDIALNLIKSCLSLTIFSFDHDRQSISSNSPAKVH